MTLPVEFSTGLNKNTVHVTFIPYLTNIPTDLELLWTLKSDLQQAKTFTVLYVLNYLYTGDMS